MPLWSGIHNFIILYCKKLCLSHYRNDTEDPENDANDSSKVINYNNFGVEQQQSTMIIIVEFQI